MTTRARVPFTTPPGRLVSGSVYKKRVKKDQAGKAKLVTKGENIGKPLELSSFGLAIPKTKGHWKDEAFNLPDGKLMAWGAIIHGEGISAFPNGQTERTDFAWKIVDGDSTAPNRKGKRPVEREGYAGCWVLHFEGFDLPGLYNSTSGKVVADPTPGLINPGDHLQVNGTVAGNDSTQTSGVYLDARDVCFRGVGPRIIIKDETDLSGFGGGVAPGASTVPAAAPMPPATPPVPASASAAPPVPTPVTPDPAYSAAAPKPAVEMVRNAAGTWPLSQMFAGNWTREGLEKAGYEFYTA